MAQPIDLGQQLSGSRIEELVGGFDLLRGGGFGFGQIETSELQFVAGRIQQGGHVTLLFHGGHGLRVVLRRDGALLSALPTRPIAVPVFARRACHCTGSAAARCSQHGCLSRLSGGRQAIGFRQDGFGRLLIGLVRGRLGRRDCSRPDGRPRDRCVVGMQW